MSETALSGTGYNAYSQEYLKQQIEAYQKMLELQQSQAYGSSNGVSLMASPSASNVDYTKLYSESSQAQSAPDTTTEKPAKKLKWYEKVGHALAGAGKAIAGAVCSIIPGASVAAKALGWKDAPSFSIKNALLAAGTIALSIVCPPAGVALAVAGGVMGAVQVGKGVVAINKAEKTAGTEDDIAAMENIGSGVLQVGLSAVGAKAGLKSCGNTTAALKTGVTEAGIKGFTTKAGNVAKAFGKDTTSSLARNTGSLGTNISKNLKGTSTIGEKAVAIKDGVVTTAKGSKLYNNIVEKGVIRGTGKTISETTSKLKEAGFKKSSEIADKAKTNLDDASTNLAKAAESAEVKSLALKVKELDLSKVDDVETLLKQMKEIDTKGLSKADIKALDDLSALTEKAQKANAKITKNAEQLEKAKKEFDEANSKADNIADNATDAELDEVIRNLDLATKRLAKAETSVGKGSAVTGAKAKVTDWAKSTTEGNLAEANKAYRNKMGMTDEPLQTVKITKEQIAADKENIQQLKKISDAADDVKAKQTKLNEANAEAKASAAKDLEKAEANLKKVKEDIMKDAKKKVDSANEKAKKAYDDGDPEQIKAAELERTKAAANYAKAESNGAIDDATTAYKNAKNNLASLEISQAAQNLNSTIIKGSVFPTVANKLDNYNNDMSQYEQTEVAYNTPTTSSTPTYTGGATLGALTCVDSGDGYYFA